MKYLILILSLAVIAGCTSQDVPLSTKDTGNDGQAIIAVGTLANANDPYDMASAPIITKVTITRISTTRAIKRQRINAEQGKLMLACTDEAIDAVNQAYEHKSMEGINQASRMADSCRAQLDNFKGAKK